MVEKELPRVAISGGRPSPANARAFIVALLAAAVLAVSSAGSSPALMALERPEGLKPAPGRMPAGHPAQADGAELGFIHIPAIGLRDTVRSGVALSVIDRGPAHWVGTAMAGESGNVVLAGHRTTKTRPFYHLDKLKPGDAILMGDGSSFPAVYRVTETLIVAPQDVWITYDTGEPIVTLFACHPRGSARQRIVVRGALRTGLPIE